MSNTEAFCIVTPCVIVVHFKWNILGFLLICCNQCDLVQFTQCPQLVEADQWRGIHHGPGNQSSPASCLTVPSSSAIISGGEDGRLCVVQPGSSQPVMTVGESWELAVLKPGSQYDTGASIVLPVSWWHRKISYFNSSIMNITFSAKFWTSKIRILPRKRGILLL